METIIKGVIIVGLALSLLLMVPITREVVRPLLGAIAAFLIFLVKESSAWVIFSAKYVLTAHKVFFTHLTTPREEFIQEDKVERLRRESRQINKKGKA